MFRPIHKITPGLFLIVTVLIAPASLGQSSRDRWIDSVFRSLDEEEKIAQLLIVPLSSEWERSKLNNIERQIDNNGIGGLLFSGGTAQQQVSITNQFQAISRIPLLIAMDAPRGPGVALDSIITFPETLALGALREDSLVYRFAAESGRQLRTLGVNMNFGPVCNLAGNNGIIEPEGTFGQYHGFVARRALIAMQGFRSQGILSCAKFFPVNGLTITQVDDGFPQVRVYVDSLPTHPFRALAGNNVTAIMPAAASLPLFYETRTSARKNKYSSSRLLSASFAGQWMKNRMGYEGIVLIDSRPIARDDKKLRNGDVELFAFSTGNEMIITDFPEASVRKIRRLVRKDAKYRTMLDLAVRKIISAKFDAGLAVRRKIPAENLMLRLNTPEARQLQQELFRNSITVIRNDENAIPVLALENRRVAAILVDDTAGNNAFHHYMRKYAAATRLTVRKPEDAASIADLLQSHDLVIAAFAPSADERNVSAVTSMLSARPEGVQIIAVDMNCPPFRMYANQFSTVITAFSGHAEIMKAVPQLIFGGINASGRLPMTIGTATEGFGITTRRLDRFSYSFPEDAGMWSPTLEKIESIAAEAINSGATPGCHVFIARDGKVVYERSFGHLTYERQIPVTDSTIYDLASITKVSATLQAVMFLHDRGMIDINKKASVYLPELRQSNKEDFTLKDILTHQAGLWPFLPFWAQTMKDSTYLPEYYQHEPSLEYPYLVADKLYASKAMRDSLWHWIITSKVREKAARTPYDYRYSDMGFYILQHLSEKLLNQPLEDFLGQNLYEPLGAYTTGYLPLVRFPVAQIAPTENDRLFRRALLIGTVHDQGAAMHGGVAGHAGLFSTANDLGKLGQMLLQNGSYGGYQYYRPETVNLFTARQFRTSRRGLGWDKPLQSDWNSPTSLYASPLTFGHTGFTGTCIWVDPAFNLVYVFLSNRVHPDMTNNKLLTGNIRSRIQDVIYESIFDYCNSGRSQPASHTVVPEDFMGRRQ